MPNHKQNKGEELKFSFPGNTFAVRTALSCVLNKLKFMKLSKEEIGTVELILAEILNNVVEHAYASDPDGVIELHITPTETGLFCKVLDKGTPMPQGEVPIGKMTPLDCDVNDLPEGGFGWFLIRNLAHDLEYARCGDQNQLCFRIAVDHRRLIVD